MIQTIWQAIVANWPLVVVVVGVLVVISNFFKSLAGIWDFWAKLRTGFQGEKLEVKLKLALDPECKNGHLVIEIFNPGPEVVYVEGVGVRIGPPLSEEKIVATQGPLKIQPKVPVMRYPVPLSNARDFIAYRLYNRWFSGRWFVKRFAAIYVQTTGKPGRYFMKLRAEVLRAVEAEIASIREREAKGQKITRPI